MRTDRKNLLIILIVVYVLFFDTHFQMPILSPFALSLGATPFLVGSIVGVYSFFNILGNAVSGYVLDANYWKTPVSVGILIITLSLFAYALAPSPLFLLGVRALHGFGGGLVVPATLAYLTRGARQGSAAGRLSRNMSYYGASIGLAALTGPPLAGILASVYGFQRTYVFIALLMAAAVLLILFFFQEREMPVRRGVAPREYLGKIRASAPLRLACRLVFALMGATGTLAASLPLKGETLGASPAVTGGLFAAFAATAIATQLYWPRLVRPGRVPLGGWALAGFLLFNAALVLIHAGQLLSTLFLALALYGLGFGLLFPALLELVVQGSQPAWKGAATAVFFIFFSLGVALVPPLGGLLQQSAAAVPPFLTAVAVSLLLLVTLPVRQRAALRSGQSR